MQPSKRKGKDTTLEDVLTSLPLLPRLHAKLFLKLVALAPKPNRP